MRRVRTEIDANTLKDELRRVHGIDRGRLQMIPTLTLSYMVDSKARSVYTYEEYRLLERKLLDATLDNARLQGDDSGL